MAVRSLSQSTLAFLAVPWAAFMAAFLFYVGVTLVAIGGEQLPVMPMVVAYGLPVAAYGLVLLARTVRGTAAALVRLAHGRKLSADVASKQIAHAHPMANAAM